MATVMDFFTYLDQRAPFALQMDFDNAGFLVGRGDGEVTRVLVALDITRAVVDEAADLGAQLIVSHHPVIFHPVRSLTDGDSTGRTLMALVKQDIAAICLHTNLDLAAGGVNDALAAAVGLTDTAPLTGEGLGRVGRLEAPWAPADYAARVKRALGAAGLRWTQGRGMVRSVAVGGGACGDLLAAAHGACCDAFVTSDVKYDVFLEADALGVTLIDAGHFPTENVVCPVLADWLREGFPQVEVLYTQRHREVIAYL